MTAPRRAHLLRYGRDQLSAWLPALLMMIFALGTWWLVRSAPRFVNAPSERTLSQDPDYYMHDFSVRLFEPDGQLKSALTGITGRHFPADDTLEVTQPRVRSYDEQGHPTIATAKRGVSNADASEIRLYGDARVVREPVKRSNGVIVPQLEFSGQFLHAFINEKRVSSDQPVELKRGSDWFTGDTLDYDQKSGIARLRGRVHGVMPPGEPLALSPRAAEKPATAKTKAEAGAKMAAQRKRSASSSPARGEGKKPRKRQ